MDGTTIPSHPSGEIIANKWSSESIKTAFETWAKAEFKITKLIQTNEQQLGDFLLELQLLVHRPNNELQAATRQSGFCTMRSGDDHSSHSSAFQPDDDYVCGGGSNDDYVCGGSNSVLERRD